MLWLTAYLSTRKHTHKQVDDSKTDSVNGYCVIATERTTKQYLCEASHSEETMHGSGALVSVHCAQLSISQRQISVTVLLVLVHCNVEGAVHGPQLVHLLFYLQTDVQLSCCIACCLSVTLPFITWDNEHSSLSCNKCQPCAADVQQLEGLRRRLCMTGPRAQANGCCRNCFNAQSCLRSRRIYPSDQALEHSRNTHMLTLLFRG